MGSLIASRRGKMKGYTLTLWHRKEFFSRHPFQGNHGIGPNKKPSSGRPEPGFAQFI